MDVIDKIFGRQILDSRGNPTLEDDNIATPLLGKEKHKKSKKTKEQEKKKTKKKKNKKNKKKKKKKHKKKKKK